MDIVDSDRALLSMEKVKIFIIVVIFRVVILNWFGEKAIAFFSLDSFFDHSPRTDLN